MKGQEGWGERDGVSGEANAILGEKIKLKVRRGRDKK